MSNGALGAMGEPSWRCACGAAQPSVQIAGEVLVDIVEEVRGRALALERLAMMRQLAAAEKHGVTDIARDGDLLAARRQLEVQRPRFCRRRAAVEVEEQRRTLPIGGEVAERRLERCSRHARNERRRLAMVVAQQRLIVARRAQRQPNSPRLPSARSWTASVARPSSLSIRMLLRRRSRGRTIDTTLGKSIKARSRRIRTP